MLSVPFALTGGLWLMYLMGFNFSVAVVVASSRWAGVAAETGVVMLSLSRQCLSLDSRASEGEGAPVTAKDLTMRCMEGAVRTGASKMMTVAAIDGRASADSLEHRRRFRSHAAASPCPLVGGQISSTLLTLVVISPRSMRSLRAGSLAELANVSHIAMCDHRMWSPDVVGWSADGLEREREHER